MSGGRGGGDERWVNDSLNRFDEWCLCFTVRYKYAYMEEKLENVAGARQVFERWMKWEPNEDAWNLYIKLEKRYKETERARQIFRRFIEIHPLPKNWLKWAKFEEDRGEFGLFLILSC